MCFPESFDASQVATPPIRVMEMLSVGVACWLALIAIGELRTIGDVHYGREIYKPQLRSGREIG